VKFWRILALLLVLSGLPSCGGFVLFVGTSPHGPNIIAVTGTCINVQVVSMVGNNGGFVTVTVVTLVTNGRSSTFNFCGDVSNRFPLNSLVTVNFTNGTPCAATTSIFVT
jgi:hypothetical protein